jgi:hypothetical protein
VYVYAGRVTPGLKFVGPNSHSVWGWRLFSSQRTTVLRARVHSPWAAPSLIEVFGWPGTKKTHVTAAGKFPIQSADVVDKRVTCCPRPLRLCRWLRLWMCGPRSLSRYCIELCCVQCGNLIQLNVEKSGLDILISLSLSRRSRPLAPAHRIGH